MIAFSNPVRIINPNPQASRNIFQVLVEREEEDQFGLRSICVCQVPGAVIPVGDIETNNSDLIIRATQTDSPSEGLAFIRGPESAISSFYRIQLLGDFVIDEEDRAIDAEFTRGQLPTGDRPQGSPFGIQGGTFRSWLQASTPEG